MEVTTPSGSQNLVDIYTNMSKPQSQVVVKPYNAQLPQDTVTFNEMSIDLDTNKDKSKNCGVCEGKINGKNAVIKEAFAEVGDVGRYFVEGIIDNKKILIATTRNANNKYAPIDWTGEYNGQEVNLSLVCQRPTLFQKMKAKFFGSRFFPDYMSISGNIGNKQVNIDIPGDDVPQDSDTKELTTLLMYERGFKPLIIDKKIVGYSFIDEYAKLFDKEMKNRDKKFDENVRPLIIGAISTATSMLIGLLIGKLGKK